MPLLGVHPVPPDSQLLVASAQKYTYILPLFQNHCYRLCYGKHGEKQTILDPCLALFSVVVGEQCSRDISPHRSTKGTKGTGHKKSSHKPLGMEPTENKMEGGTN